MTQEVFLTAEKFNSELESCLTILEEPSKDRLYYLCEYITPALYSKVVKVVVE